MTVAFTRNNDMWSCESMGAKFASAPKMKSKVTSLSRANHRIMRMRMVQWVNRTEPATHKEKRLCSSLASTVYHNISITSFTSRKTYSTVPTRQKETHEQQSLRSSTNYLTVLLLLYAEEGQRLRARRGLPRSADSCFWLS